MKYLYGAAVQGIQQFIFQTNDLKDIVGASELVENICTTLFAKILYDTTNEKDLLSILKNDDNAVINAAGNIKYIFNSEEECKRVVRIFPKSVVMYAPGITISQTVVKYEDESDFAEIVNELERKLRAQRNKPMASVTSGLMGIRRSRKTGLPVTDIEIVKGETNYLDQATLAKRYEILDGKKKRRNILKLPEKAFGKKVTYEDVALNIEDMKGKNDWIAVIHADGNGLGQVVQKIGTNEKIFKIFSRELDAATIKSAQEAFKNLGAFDGVIPLRPIVLGGDDLTVVCRADLAIKFVKKFIENFEDNTQFEELDGVFANNEKRLTVCAGIAFIKSSYPFYYGYNLAEALCTRAKTDAKRNLKKIDGKMELPSSCLMFHKVQDSFVDNYNDIVSRELSPCKNVSFEFGPYYIKKEDCKPGGWTVEKLLKCEAIFSGKGLKDIDKGNALKSNLRNWLTLLHDNPGMADQRLERIKQQLDTRNEDDKHLLGLVSYITDLSRNGFCTPVYDVLALHTLFTQETT